MDEAEQRTNKQMSAAPFIARKLRAVARVVEKPSLLRVRKQGVLLDVYEKLDLPWLHQINFATLLDIGAAVGDFSRAAKAVWPDIRIFAFEPIPSSFGRLQQNISKLSNCHAFNVALGEKPGEVSFQQSSAQDSSSLLKMSDLHKEAFPQTAQTQTITIKMDRLDSFAQRLDIRAPLLIKIDVQGYENHVLQGGMDTVAKAKVLIVETSFAPLYENQALFPQIHDDLRALGFTFQGVLDQIHHPTDRRALQIDAIFVRT